MTRPRSKNLFHFTSKLEYLKSILRQGFHPRYCMEDLNWFLEDFSLAYPMVCFCDIPLARVGQHVGGYGSYGIGMSRPWAIRKKLNPIIYLSKDSFLTDTFGELSGVISKTEGEINDKGSQHFFELMRYIKPMTGKMKIKGVLTENVDFYQESEWRYVPTHKKIHQFIEESNWNEVGVPEAANKGTLEYCLLDFNAEDIRYLFVEKDSDIPELVDFIRSSESGLGARFTGDQMKILETRIVSQESLVQDL